MTGIADVLQDLRQAPNIHVRWRMLADIARRKIVSRFRKQHIVYKAGPQAYEPISAKVPITFRRCIDAEQVPNTIWVEGGHHNKVLFRDGAAIWVVFVEDRPAAYMWMKPATHIKKWYVPLGDGDIVLFAAGTLRAYRGLGIHRALMHHIVVADGKDGTVWCDAHEWNVTAQKSFEKAGFEFVSVQPPLH